MENEACHSLLWRIRGHSNMYKKDIQEELEVLKQRVEKRKKL